MENQQTEATRAAIKQLQADFNSHAESAAGEIRRLHTRVQELEKDRGNAKRLVSKIWNQHPEARDTIEKATGAWLVFGQDVETSGVSAQRVTQGKDHIAQDRKMVSAPVVLPDGWTIVPVEPTPPMVEAGATERITPHITAGHGAIAAFKAMLEHAPEYPALASTTAAAPVVLPEPIGYAHQGQLDNISDGYAYVYPMESPSTSCKLYTEQQVRDLLAEAACTKSQTAQEPFGYFKAEPFGWRDCAENDEGAIALYEAPQPQAEARAAERVDALYKALEVCSAELFAQCSHQGRAMKYVEQARKALAAEQCARAAIAKATGAHHD